MFKAKQGIWDSGLACEMCLVCLQEGKAGSWSAGINNITAQVPTWGEAFDAFSEFAFKVTLLRVWASEMVECCLFSLLFAHSSVPSSEMQPFLG